MKPYKKPDLNAPRFRPKKLNLLNQEFVDEVYKVHPELKERYTPKQIKAMVETFNGCIWQQVLDYRDGVELPEQLGYLFIGTCPRKVFDNTNYHLSEQLGVKVQQQNWESDQYTAKIFYTNYETKYHFKFHELWGFKAVRDFRRTTAKVYPVEWKKYVVVDPMLRISRLFRKQKAKEYIQNKTLSDLENYDEFDMGD